jgi:hypothetical protein
MRPSQKLWISIIIISSIIFLMWGNIMLFNHWLNVELSPFDRIIGLIITLCDFAIIGFILIFAVFSIVIGSKYLFFKFNCWFDNYVYDVQAGRKENFLNFKSICKYIQNIKLSWNK